MFRTCQQASCRLMVAGGGWALNRRSFQLAHAGRLAKIMRVKVPALGGETIHDGQIFFVDKKVGDTVAKEDLLANIETEKINVPVLSPSHGVIERIVVENEATVAIGDDLFEIRAEEEEEGETSKVHSRELDERKEQTSKVEQQQVAVKIESDDQRSSLRNEDDRALLSSSDRAHQTFQPMSRMRSKIAQSLKHSQNTAASLTTFNEVDMSALIELRTRYKEQFEKKYGTKLGFMSTFVTATVRSLLDHPDLNAVIIDENKTVAYRHYVDLGIAVSTQKGLVVPILRNAERLSYPAIEKSIADLAKKARSRQLTSDDLEAGTFTLTNTGVHGALLGTPIITPGQSAILGIYGCKRRPIVLESKDEEEEKIVVRSMAYLSLTYDHRLIDGEQAASFVNTVKALIEQPIKNLFRI